MMKAALNHHHHLHSSSEQQRILDWYQGQRSRRRSADAQHQQEQVKNNSPQQEHHSNHPANSNHAPEESSLLLVTGAAGSGQAETVRQGLARTVRDDDGGYLLRGAFDVLQHPQPYAAFTAAFQDLVDAVRHNDDSSRRRAIRRDMQSVLRTAAHTLAEIFPSLLELLKKEAADEEAQPIEAASGNGDNDNNDADTASSSNQPNQRRFVSVRRQASAFVARF